MSPQEGSAASRQGPAGAVRVAVLKGGRSLERGVSLRSGAQIEDALQRLGHETVVIDVGSELVAQLRSAQPDVAFIALHGRDGEDGTVQELLEAIGIPYTGSGALACAQCADKVLAKHLMRSAGLPTPDYYSFNETSFRELGAGAALPDIERELGFPLVVKPAGQGSALGIKFARSSREVPGALVAAFSYDRRILLERHVSGRDLAVSVLDAAEEGQPLALPVVEAVPRDQDFYDFESRYGIGRTTFVCPAPLPEELSSRVQELALAVYRLLGCHGFARVDLMLDQDSQEMFVLEAETIPGFTETSLLPQAADAAGIHFDELVSRILASAWTRA
jgi:D-alanine-D-alanine ligase